VIAVSSKGRSFRALATYLAAGRTGQERERVAWSSARNLPTNDPELAGTIMRATAERSTRVEHPVYHLVLSFDPNDAVDRATMERVADRVLSRIQLQEHQAVIVAHRDREHAHVHVLVNRVHPETGRAWEYSFDYRAIQEVLREEERALGIRQVPGRYRDVGVQRGMSAGERVDPPAITAAEPDQSNSSRMVAEERRTLPKELESGPLLEPDTSFTPEGESGLGTRPEASRVMSRTADSDQVLVDRFAGRIRERVPVLRAVASWAEMESALASDGLWIEPRGQGLVVTDGVHTVKASAIARDLARGRLEARFGKALPTYLAERNTALQRASGDEVASAMARENRGPEKARAERVPGSPESRIDGDTVGTLRRQIEEYEHVSALVADRYAENRALNVARATLAKLEASVSRAQIATEHFERELGKVYRDPAAARAAFEKTAGSDGIGAAVQAMRERPERFGTLLAVDQPRAFGIRGENDTPARQAALSAAVRGREACEARLTVANMPEQQVREAVVRAIGRERTAREAVRRGPDTTRLEREIGHALGRLLPREIEELRRAVTQPQFAMAMKIRQAAREALLGREVPER
jgi:hypothetical protein